MADYVSLPIETDPDEIVQDAFDYIESKVPSWLPSEGNFEVILLEALALMSAETRDLASDVPTTIFRYFGATLMGLPPIDAASASVNSTWTVTDNAGYTIPEGTAVGIPAAGDELIGFTVATEVIIAPGDTATAAGEVVLVAVEPGEEANGLTDDPQVIDSLAFVETIVLIGATAGGADAEEDSVYMDRLTAELQLLTPRPILAKDFAILSRRHPAVYRATALDGYEPVGPSSGNEKTVSIAAVDENGALLSSQSKTELDDMLQELREINFLVYVIDPTITDIDVTYTAVALPGFDPDAVEASVEQALNDYLSAVSWGVPAGGNPRDWVNTDTLRYLELATVINGADGLDYITALTFRKAADAFATTDVTLPGAAPIPNLDALVGTVSAP